MPEYKYENVNVTVLEDGVAHVELNRPKNLNAFNDGLFGNVRQVFLDLSNDSNIRAVVVSAAGRMFTAGLDLTEASITKKSSTDVDAARKAWATRQHLQWFQSAYTAIEQCNKPVIGVVHNGCIGAGVNMITACDIRYCSKDAYFNLKEVDVGLAADVGALQRLPKVVVNDSAVREICLTARNVYADEAYRIGLVNKVLDTKEQAIEEALKTARLIATKSPVAVLGTKHLLNYSRDHSVQEGLLYTAAWNSAMLNTEDIPKSFQAFVQKKPAVYSKL